MLPPEQQLSTYSRLSLLRGRCASAMFFDQYDLAENYPYELDAEESRMVKNVQYLGENALPVVLLISTLVMVDLP